ncbi:MAG: hypothetical protein Q8R85_00035 [Bosea sp. (in: a-proteobacteria)]|uniref:hypothetical protein n=1 Tax=Bosea sp. (in: a-proteobacteria) TaxID=1871050 RepID=UPI0027340F0B|nr:hypothetical protein [Bosea sp. (in: a-proteobacteria)]MDP3599539.1 hypothetical protein [Bosea sp. (in: a-proteobacteria)]
MTTQRQIKRFVAPLLQRNPDVMYRTYWLYMKPIRHVVRLVTIQGSSSADYALVDASVDFSFNLSPAAWGWPVGRGEGLLVWDDPAIHPVVRERIEDAFDRMRPLTTLEAFEEFASQPRAFYTSGLDAYRDCQLRVDIALGRLDKALVECRELHRLYTEHAPDNDYSRIFQRLTSAALPLLETKDIGGLVDLLKQWQNHYITGRKLEAVFEQTPFPLETMTGRR